MCDYVNNVWRSMDEYQASRFHGAKGGALHNIATKAKKMYRPRGKAFSRLEKLALRSNHHRLMLEVNTLYLSFRNKKNLLKDGVGGCYVCQSLVRRSSVVSFADGGETGVCLMCGNCSVIPGVSGRVAISMAHAYVFGGGGK